MVQKCWEADCEKLISKTAVDGTDYGASSRWKLEAYGQVNSKRFESKRSKNTSCD